MSDAELEDLKAEQGLQLYREYRDVARLFSYTVHTQEHLYLANEVDLQARTVGEAVYFEAVLTDAWVWDSSRPTRVPDLGPDRHHSRDPRPGDAPGAGTCAGALTMASLPWGSSQREPVDRSRFAAMLADLAERVVKVDALDTDNGRDNPVLQAMRRDHLPTYYQHARGRKASA
jgi:hypothetical protein